MFLNGLKEKSILRQIKKELATRDYIASNTKPAAIAILQEQGSPFDSLVFEKLLSVLKLKKEDIVLLEFVKKISKDQKAIPSLYSEKDIGWRGVFKTQLLKDFKKQRFDMLISYYHTDALALKAVTAMSNAALKIGVTSEGESMNDLTIHIKPGKEELFVEELEKYLKILKVIN